MKAERVKGRDWESFGKEEIQQKKRKAANERVTATSNNYGAVERKPNAAIIVFKRC